ncbi:MAG: metalloregulator ArsR/SmtB family transcription factor [Armatimonadota bacterium]|nr:metalloregulator ArsR/SmtB family transcription factor [Armatimonadota bacterium]
MTPATTLTARPRCACGRRSHAGALDHDALEARAAVLTALGDPVRLGIVELLAGHDRLCVCDIVEAFPLGQPTISHHLRVLREAGLVDVERRGHWAFYGLRRDALKRVAQDLVRLL